MLQEITHQVNLLTLPIPNTLWQDLGKERGGRKLHTSYAPALLDQLRDSQTSGGGTGATGVGEKRASSIMDFAAMERYRTIRTDIYDMLIKIGGTPATATMGDPKDELRRWLRLYSRLITLPGIPPSDPKVVKYNFQRLRGWVFEIEAKFDPPVKKEILIECPNTWTDNDGIEYTCGERYYYNAMGDRESSLVALISGEGLVRVVCRSCGGNWDGTAEITILGRLFA